MVNKEYHHDTDILYLGLRIGYLDKEAKNIIGLRHSLAISN